MARDGVSLLQSLGVKKAHVLGVSMGGMIAQQIASAFPGMVNRLILCCTTCGGPNSIPAPPETVRAMTAVEGLTPEEALRQAMEVAFAPGYVERNREEFDQLIERRLEKPTPRYAWEHQFNAVLGFNSESWAGQI